MLSTCGLSPAPQPSSHSPYIRPTQQAAAGRGGTRGAKSTARGYEGGDGLGRVAGVVGHDSCKQRQQGRPPRGELGGSPLTNQQGHATTKCLEVLGKLPGALKQPQG
ncbi:hypothetical protein Pmani_007470 [Petrolisthes manimaculis]|uniref:Uncharacterized protein n=1 Tax=Petrolisthes manimaculis TaxID=1843537 RepID=A0AAE1Q7J5_9EUCA|nr:hypothetical protein Pmani_007470 [Petrolisthes manimaculis]